MKTKLTIAFIVAAVALITRPARADEPVTLAVPEGMALVPANDSPVPHDFTCGTLVYNQTVFGTFFFINNPGTGGVDGFTFDQLTLGSTNEFRNLCSIQAGFGAGGGAPYTVTCRVYSACPTDLGNGGVCFGAPQLLGEVTSGQVPSTPAGQGYAVNFDFAPAILVPDTIWVGFKVNGNTTAGPAGGTTQTGTLPIPTVGTLTANGDAARCSSNGTSANSCGFDLAANTNDNWYFRIGAQSTTACTVPPAGGATLENELNCGIPTDTVNGGCNQGNNFLPLPQTGITYAGTFGNNGTLRDQDWYQTTVASGHRNISMTVRAEAAVIVFLAKGDCPTYVMSFAQGPPCSDVVLSACVPAGTYTIVVETATFAGVPCGAKYNATFTSTVCTPNPATDFCVDATEVTAGTTPFTTVGAISDGPEVLNGCDGTIDNDIWFKYIATDNDTVTIDTCNAATTYDSNIEVYDGCDCNNLIPMACNQNTVGCGSGPALDDGASVQVSVTQGNCYLIRVGSPGTLADPVNNSGPGVLTISVACPNQTICPAAPGDVNFDFNVDGLDVQTFAGCFVQGPCVPSQCECADMDFNFLLNQADVTAFIAALLVP